VVVSGDTCRANRRNRSRVVRGKVDDDWFMAGTAAVVLIVAVVSYSLRNKDPIGATLAQLSPEDLRASWKPFNTMQTSGVMGARG